MKARIILPAIALLLLFGACHKQPSQPVVARAYDNYLYLSDIEGLVGEGVSAEDSVAIVNNYINQWLQQMVVLHKAKRNVDNRFEKELQNYKNSLITYEYERLIIEQMLDTNVSDADIEAYYNSNKDNFTLKSSIVKAVYLKLAKDSEAVPKAKKAISVANFGDDALDEIQRLSSVYAVDYSFDLDAWVPFYTLLCNLPVENYNEAELLRRSPTIVTSDDEFTYLVRILDYKVADEVSPLEFEYDNIRTILLNRRKIDIIKNMQRDLIKKAELDKEIERFD